MLILKRKPDYVSLGSKRFSMVFTHQIATPLSQNRKWGLIFLCNRAKHTPLSIAPKRCSINIYQTGFSFKMSCWERKHTYFYVLSVGYEQRWERGVKKWWLYAPQSLFLAKHNLAISEPQPLSFSMSIPFLYVNNPAQLKSTASSLHFLPLSHDITLMWISFLKLE